MSMLLQSLAPRVAQRTPALVATRSLATTSVRCNQGSSSSSSAAGVPTPANSSSHYGSRGDESQGRNLPAEQKSRHDHAIDASITSDAPPELHQRSVRIFKPAKTANSSGRAGTHHWQVDWDILQGSARWENPLMGWASSGDYMQGTSLKFKTKDQAMQFCTKQGWDYFVQEPHVHAMKPNVYASNYKHSPGKLRVHHTK
ncbi:unnamed protein product [Jaminaea pallidilutea]